MGYRYGNYRWKPNKEEKRVFIQQMKEIDDFCRENNINASSTNDSYYFEIDGQKYRVSNHSVEASNMNSDGLYHEDGRRDDTIYIHASKTRIMEIYSNLKEGKNLDGKGNIKK